MKISLLYLPSVGTPREMESGIMPPKQSHIYQRMLDDLEAQVQLADELGYDTVFWTEHHFQVEGMECPTNPLLMALYFGLKTTRIRQGTAGNQLVNWNPVRLAEDAAMVDHMLRGRLSVGFARGFMTREVNTLAQQLHVSIASPTAQDIDRANREAFIECYEVVKKAWTRDTFEHQGKYWKIPAPGSTWPVHMRGWGQGVGEDGTVQQIGIIPAPYQRPHPPLFVAFSLSPETITWAAREGITPIFANANVPQLTKLMTLYQETAREAGHDLRFGEHCALALNTLIAPTDAEAEAIARAGHGWMWGNFYGSFGFYEGLRTADDPPGQPVIPTYERLQAAGGEILVGSPATVAARLRPVIDALNLEHLVLITPNELTPHAHILRSLRLFQEEIAPKLGVSVSVT